MSHDNWQTPPDLFRVLDNEFIFVLDAAADASNTKCARFISAEQDALRTEWDGDSFCNPPYSMTAEFLQRAYEQSQTHHTTNVVLIPTYTETKYWREWATKAHEIRHLVGRLRFSDGVKNDSARFPSSILVFKYIPGTHYGYSPHVWSWDWRTAR